MITIQDAVNATLAYVKTFEGLMPSSNIRLEEFKYDDGLETWSITLSFAEPSSSVGAGFQVIGPAQRSFKTFTVDAMGQVIAMRIRNPLNP